MNRTPVVERLLYSRAVEFEWDPRKEAANRRKHGIGFDEAQTVFADPWHASSTILITRLKKKGSS